jgi:hypothetical protein
MLTWSFTVATRKWYVAFFDLVASILDISGSCCFLSIMRPAIPFADIDASVARLNIIID